MKQSKKNKCCICQKSVKFWSVKTIITIDHKMFCEKCYKNEEKKMEYKSELRDEIDDLKSKIDELENEINQFKSGIKEMDRLIDNLKYEINELKD